VLSRADVPGQSGGALFYAAASGLVRGMQLTPRRVLDVCMPDRCRVV
jgi:hypothetical protein